MTERKVPVQSLIDHIKTAIDVDPWAKEMAEDMLKEKEVKQHISDAIHETAKQFRRQIVMCKDCRFKECEGRDGLIVCDITGESHQPEWFCADGER